MTDEPGPLRDRRRKPPPRSRRANPETGTNLKAHPTRADLKLDCAKLRNGMVASIEVDQTSTLGDASLVAARVLDNKISVKATVTVAGSALVMRGRLGATWAAECRRCLCEVCGPLEAQLEEIFEDRPREGETWPVIEDRIDLAPALREVALLALPLAPLCSPDCAGPVPNRFPTGPVASATPNPPASAGATDTAAGDEDDRPIDPRWAALAELRFDD